MVLLLLPCKRANAAHASPRFPSRQLHPTEIYVLSTPRMRAVESLWFQPADLTQHNTDKPPISGLVGAGAGGRGVVIIFRFR